MSDQCGRFVNKRGASAVANPQPCGARPTRYVRRDGFLCRRHLRVKRIEVAGQLEAIDDMLESLSRPEPLDAQGMASLELDLRRASTSLTYDA